MKKSQSVLNQSWHPELALNKFKNKWSLITYNGRWLMRETWRRSTKPQERGGEPKMWQKNKRDGESKRGLGVFKSDTEVGWGRCNQGLRQVVNGRCSMQGLFNKELTLYFYNISIFVKCSVIVILENMISIKQHL